MPPILADATPILFVAIFVAIILLNIFASYAKTQQQRQQRERMQRELSQRRPTPDYSDTRRPDPQGQVDEMRRLRELAGSKVGRAASKLDAELRRRRQEAERLREQARRQIRQPQRTPATRAQVPPPTRAQQGWEGAPEPRKPAPRPRPAGRPSKAVPVPATTARLPALPPVPAMKAMTPPPPPIGGVGGVAGARAKASPTAVALKHWLTPQTLRSQFILTEILQPPLALREREV